MKSGELARKIGGSVIGDGEVELRGPRSFFEAGPRDLCFYAGNEPGELARSNAGCVITGVHPETFEACSLIVVEDVRLAWARALVFFPGQGEESSKEVTFVSSSASVHPSTVLLPFTYVGPKTVIGPECIIGPNVTVHAGTDIGSGVVIGSGSVIGSAGFGYVTDSQGNHHHIRHLGRVVVEDHVHIGAGVCIDRGTTGETRIGQGTKIDNLVHIAHNVRIGKRCLIAGQSGIAGSSVLADNVQLAGQVGIRDHVNIGEGAVILAKSAVFKNVPAGAVYSGTPARPHRQTLRAQARMFNKLLKEGDQGDVKD